jgi:hypothetical protein
MYTTPGSNSLDLAWLFETRYVSDVVGIAYTVRLNVILCVCVCMRAAIEWKSNHRSVLIELHVIYLIRMGTER